MIQAPPAPGSAPLADPLHAGGDAIEKLIDDLRSFSLEWVVPYQAALSPRIMRNPAVGVMLFFGFFPLVMLSLGMVHDPGELVLALTAYYCLAWAGWFYYFVARRSVSLPDGLGAMAFTAFVGTSMLLTVQSVPFIRSLYDLTRADDPVRVLVGYMLSAGVLEECTKALPVLYLAYGAGKIHKPMDGLFYGAMSGLGFAISEGALYISASSELVRHGGMVSPTLLIESALVQTLIRTTTLPFMHALWAATSGYFIGLSLINKRRASALVVIGLAIPAIHHGAYDAFSTQVPLVATALALFLYLLFVAYIDRSQQMVIELQQAEQGLDRAREEALRAQLWQQYVAPGPPPPRAPGSGLPTDLAPPSSPPQGPGSSMSPHPPSSPPEKE